MSNFNGHFTGGLIATAVTTVVAVTCASKFNLSMQVSNLAFVAGSTLFFSLFPDIDIKSKPSKMFYSAFFVLLCYLYITKQFQTATILSMLAVTPQMTKHRGIFHHKLTALMIPGYVFILSSQHYITSTTALFAYVAGVAGYYTHLLLDNEF